VLVKLRPAAVADSLFVPAVIAVEPMGYRWYRLILASDVDRAAVLHHLDRLDVEITQDNHRYVLDGMPNDPYFDQQYAHALTEAAAGWDVTTGATDIIAAVLDGGIDLSHVDLVDNLHVNQREEPGNGIDDDANGFVDD